MEKECRDCGSTDRVLDVTVKDDDGMRRTAGLCEDCRDQAHKEQTDQFLRKVAETALHDMSEDIAFDVVVSWIEDNELVGKIKGFWD